MGVIGDVVGIFKGSGKSKRKSGKPATYVDQGYNSEFLRKLKFWKAGQIKDGSGDRVDFGIQFQGTLKKWESENGVKIPFGSGEGFRSEESRADGQTNKIANQLNEENNSSFSPTDGVSIGGFRFNPIVAGVVVLGALYFIFKRKR